MTTTSHEVTQLLPALSAGDEELLREVSALLAYDDPAASFIDAPAIQVAARALAAESLSESHASTEANPVTRRIGAYQLLGPPRLPASQSRRGARAESRKWLRFAPASGARLGGGEESQGISRFSDAVERC